MKFNWSDESIMEEMKKKSIELLVDTAISSFSEGFESNYTRDVDNPDGVINRKKNNVFITELGEEFMFYSAFVRSFDSSFGNVLETLGNNIAKLSYEVRKDVTSFYLPQQEQHVAYMINEYSRRTKPQISDYEDFTCMIPADIRSFETTHVTDHYFYNKENSEHCLIELKLGGDLDNKKAKSEKAELLKEYFILKNSLLKDENTKNDKVYLKFATAYNKNGEGNFWKQERVKQFFAEDELLIGKDYWNFVCNDEHGFEIVFEQYKKSAIKIREALVNVKDLYFYL